MENKPLSIIPIHDYLSVHLCDLYENDCIFDKFECCSDHNGKRFVTGSYNNNFVIHSSDFNCGQTIEALRDGLKPKPQVLARQNAIKNGSISVNKGKMNSGLNNSRHVMEGETQNVNLMDFGKKALHVSWHPRANIVAVAGLNKLYIYQALNDLGI